MLAECRDDDDCGDGVCDIAVHECVGCVDDSDCAAFQRCEASVCELREEVGPATGGVDVLFVVDNSGTMDEEQALAGGFIEQFITSLEAEQGSRPDLHIGVISTNMGAGPYAIDHCADNGDGGALQNTARVSGCVPPADRYLVDVADGTGGRTTNYAGSLGEAFSCIARLGTDGCGFEQPLAALQAALTHPANAGFLRDDAALAIVFLGDEDDCSALDTKLYDSSQDSLSDPLGPLNSFRCFEFGVVCDPDAPRTHGAKHGCEPRTGSYLVDPAEVAAAVYAIRLPGRVAVATIVGNWDTVAVGPDPERPHVLTLQPSCSSTTGRAFPAIRLHAFADAFPGHTAAGSICADSYQSPLAGLAAQIAEIIE